MLLIIAKRGKSTITEEQVTPFEPFKMGRKKIGNSNTDIVDMNSNTLSVGLRHRSRIRRCCATRSICQSIITIGEKNRTIETGGKYWRKKLAAGVHLFHSGSMRNESF